MKALLNIVICCAAAIGGTFASTTLKAKNPADAPAVAEASADKKDDHSTDKHAKEKKSEDKGKKDSHAKSSDDFEFLRFKRQFVVPVIGEDRVEALVLLNIGISLSGNVKEELFRLEPKFRDAFMRELLNMSNSGYFDDELTNPQTYEVLRETLLRAAKDIEKDGVEDILILDFARQDR